ncbi:hypothetical protein EJ05DRAFT_541436 [Pseudovirgaria hyperparasitica]|uniref:Uncharacterized protein n=1 Tax=Pseudovirgaria hyperparasitica TaxID=470096 RepID=A0A6A6VT55_9PEZI|nr:uncharacterized protein EJ05DRAFT_541436 [Pseudovirgaria hyperparasitica]KAF2753858.1 hypothetical protein EJ05DRAFT_541436 [Pseudovirgaria hyperparasitica]
MQGSFSTIPCAYVFENTSSVTDFMPTEQLKKALANTLETFSILLGHLRHKVTGNILIELDPDNINHPEFLDWPPSVVTVGPIATTASDSEIHMLNVHVIRLKENSGLVLFISVLHYAFDDANFFVFVNSWADTMYGMVHSAVPPIRRTYSFDRSIVRSYLTTSGQVLIDPTSHAIYSTPNVIIDWSTLLSHTTLGAMLSKTTGLAKGEAHLFHVSQRKLNELHQMLQPHLIFGTSHISDNDILVALIRKLGPPQVEEHASVRVPFDLRSRLNVKENYTENCLTGLLIRDQVNDLRRPTNAATLADAAAQVQSTVSSVSPQLVSEFVELISAHPTSYLRPLALTASRMRTFLVCTTCVSLTPLFASSLSIVAFLPPMPSTDGVNVLLSSNPTAMKGMLVDPFWENVGELVW